MPYTVVAFETRKLGMTPEAYEDHKENIHMPLVKSIVGDAFPLSHSRYYLKRNSGAAEVEKGTEALPFVLYGTAEDFNYDCMIVMVFEDFSHFIRFKEAFDNTPRKAELEEDMEKFIIQSKLKAVVTEDARVTPR
ncbi:hypothetical protein P154DRAFT_536626 [Amniculicola lignicola CBS 123094]|uniref:EthD domain-containing protein n=1 Tax=Amniculicola lignicola CBS 123094 TaxID=1392246 RepID=A0A6A5W8E9_9PLEO|nr:hypothetical protein P154DRAFT_536626 [Amniculicola lignicola CBS 123094]